MPNAQATHDITISKIINNKVRSVDMAKMKSNDIASAIESTPTAQEVHDTPNASITQDESDTSDKLSDITPIRKSKNKSNIKDTSVTKNEKNQKLPRINMAFTLDNLEYLHIISRIEGVSMTEYVNLLIAKDKSQRTEEIEKAKSLLKNI